MLVMGQGVFFGLGGYAMVAVEDNGKGIAAEPVDAATLESLAT